MSRHRNVRSMNYSEEYDGYDDVYGHSVEDEYCISPSDEAQFMYDRTRQPQMSAFFSEQDNITEEDEHADEGKDSRNSDIYQQPALSDIDEARLRSCLEEIRNVIGDSIAERILVKTVLKCDFNVNKSLDTVLSNATASSSDPTSDIPKPQRVRKERDRDSINFQTCLLGLIHHSDVKQSDGVGQKIELQNTDSIPCEDILLSDKCVQYDNEGICDELNLKYEGSVAFCNSILELSDKNVQENATSREFYTNSNTSFVYHNIHIPFVFDNRTEGNQNSSINLEKKCCNVSYERELVHVELTEVENGSAFGVTCKSNDKSCLEMGESKGVLFQEVCSSDEKYSSSPLAAFAKQHSSVSSENKVIQKHPLDIESKNFSDSSDPCPSFTSLRIQDYNVHAPENIEDKGGILNVLENSGTDVRFIDRKKMNPDDNSDDEKSLFSPLAVLANKHHKKKSTENNLSDETKSSINLLFSKSETIPSQNKSCDDGVYVSKVMRSTELVSDSICGDGRFHSSDMEDENAMLLDKSSDEEESVFSPLAALADRYHKGKEASPDSSVAYPGLKGVFANVSSYSSPSELKCTHRPAVSTCVLTGTNNKELNAEDNESLCTSKSLAGSSSSAQSCHFRKRDTKNVSALKSKSLSTRNMNCNMCKEDDEVLMLGQAISETVTIPKEISQEDLTCDKSVFSLSDLAFYHLKRSASCNVKSDHEVMDMKFHSDTGISKSVPGGFVIPFLKSEEEILCTSREVPRNSEKITDQLEAKEESFDQSLDSADEWVIDLSSAVRDPGLRAPCNFVDDKSPVQIIDEEHTAEVQEYSRKNFLAPCELDASGMLKMKFSYTNRRCSPFGNVLCHHWRELAKPYILPRRQNTGTVIHFTFSTSSPDDKILFHLKGKR